MDPTTLKMVDDPTTEEINTQIRDEQDDILRDLHRELESLDRRVTRSRARALSIPLRPSTEDPDSTRRRGKLPVRSNRRRANAAVRLIEPQSSEQVQFAADDEDEEPPQPAFLGFVEPEYDDEGNVLTDGDMLNSDSSSSSSDDEL